MGKSGGFTSDSPTMATRYLGRFARFYNGNFDRRPIPTLMVTNGILNTIADICVS